MSTSGGKRSKNKGASSLIMKQLSMLFSSIAKLHAPELNLIFNMYLLSCCPCCVRSVVVFCNIHTFRCLQFRSRVLISFFFHSCLYSNIQCGHLEVLSQVTPIMSTSLISKSAQKMFHKTEPVCSEPLSPNPMKMTLGFNFDLAIMESDKDKRSTNNSTLQN